ncbi:MAG: cell wall-binding repeat-containing protein [Clostridium sp.]
MKKSSKVISSFLIGASLMSTAQPVFAVESKEIIREKVLAGQSRYESAVAVSKEGWKSSENAVLVNGAALVDALAATPYAKMKDAPILLTQKDSLTKETKKELVRLNVKNVTIVGGENVVSNSVEKSLKDMGIKIERLSGQDRFDTSLNVAKELDVKAVAVVNGMSGRLSDAMSIASPAAKNNMAIVLTDGKNSEDVKNFIDDKKVDTTYVVGGQAVVSKNVETALDAKRLGGENRAETNAKVLTEFYNDKIINNIYVAKDGSNKESELVDALSAGALASKENSPVMILGSELSNGQKEFLSTKQVEMLTRVGHGISDKAVEQIYDALKVISAIDVTTIEELQEAIKNSRDNTLVRFNANKEINTNYDIKTNKEITLELDGKHSGNITIDMPNGDVINNGELKGTVLVEDIKDGTFLNKGTVEHMIIKDTNGASIVSGDKATVKKVTIKDKAQVSMIGKMSEVVVDGKGAKVKIGEKAQIEKVNVTKNASETKLENRGEIIQVKVHEAVREFKINTSNGKIEKLEGSKDVILDGKENVGTFVEGSSNTNKGGSEYVPTPSKSKDKEDKNKEKINIVKEESDLIKLEELAKKDLTIKENLLAAEKVAYALEENLDNMEDLTLSMKLMPRWTVVNQKVTDARAKFNAKNEEAAEKAVSELESANLKNKEEIENAKELVVKARESIKDVVVPQKQGYSDRIFEVEGKIEKAEEDLKAANKNNVAKEESDLAKLEELAKKDLNVKENLLAAEEVAYELEENLDTMEDLTLSMKLMPRWTVVNQKVTDARAKFNAKNEEAAEKAVSELESANLKNKEEIASAKELVVKARESIKDVVVPQKQGYSDRIFEVEGKIEKAEEDLKAANKNNVAKEESDLAKLEELAKKDLTIKENLLAAEKVAYALEENLDSMEDLILSMKLMPRWTVVNQKVTDARVKFNAKNEEAAEKAVSELESASLKNKEEIENAKELVVKARQSIKDVVVPQKQGYSDRIFEVENKISLQIINSKVVEGDEGITAITEKEVKESIKSELLKLKIENITATNIDEVVEKLYSHRESLKAYEDGCDRNKESKDKEFYNMNEVKNSIENILKETK